MFVEGVPVKSRQKLLRHLRVVDSIVLLLKAPFKCPKGWSGGKRVHMSGNHGELTHAEYVRSHGERACLQGSSSSWATTRTALTQRR